MTSNDNNHNSLLLICIALPQCFSHAPGHMFICDITTAAFQERAPSSCKNHIPCVAQITENPKRFSVLSKTAKNKISRLEGLLLNDIGQRGVEHLSAKDDLLKSLLRLYQASSVGITFGFPVFGDDAVAEETDGMPGAIAIAKALCPLGKKVNFIIDRRNEVLLKRVIQRCVKTNILKKEVPMLVYERQANRETTAMQFLYQSDDGSALFDHLVSIERTGPSRDGTYRSMKNKTLKEDLVAPVEDLFLQGKTTVIVFVVYL